MPKIFLRKDILGRFLQPSQLEQLEKNYQSALFVKGRHRKNWDKEKGRKHPNQKAYKVANLPLENNANVKLTLKEGSTLEFTIK